MLDAEIKLGELVAKRPEQIRSSQGGTSKPLPTTINKKESHYLQAIANNRDVVEQAKAERPTLCMVQRAERSI